MTVADKWTSDSVDENIEFWARLVPEIDTATEGIVERVQALSKRFDRSMEETASRHGINYGEWKVLHVLRRAEPDYRSTPGKLSHRLGLSSGAMTNRLDRLEEAGLVRRLPDPNDRRSVVVELTEEGLKRWQQATATQAEKESLVAASLGERDKERLNALLRRLMVAFERES